ncbi:tetratricopeptide repeat protein [Runella sp.]|uniref:tetratricopeptide repeat protein n=1 Tax=Runella sp. TaxID=1960881 RepID=UPI00260EE111|nr:tetratricopeptide repeat protein [Runella sp.]
MKYIIIISLSALLLSSQSCSFSSEDMLEKGKSLMKEGKFRDALTYLNKAIEGDNANYEALNARGVVYYELREYTNALLDYDQALKLKPDYYRPYYNRALLKVAQSDGQGALKDYSEAIRLDSRNAEIFVNRGQLLAALGQTDAALRDFDQAVNLDENNAMAWYNRGNVLFQQGDFKRSIENFEKAVKNDTKFSKAFHALGIAQLMLQQKDQGCLNLKQADRLGYPSAKVSLEQYCK